MEQVLAEFKRTHANALPDEMGRNQDTLDQRQRDLYDYSAQVRLAEQKEAILALQLRDVSPTLQGAVSNRATELATLRAELADAEQRYTPDHPGRQAAQAGNRRAGRFRRGVDPDRRDTGQSRIPSNQQRARGSAPRPGRRAR